MRTIDMMSARDLQDLRDAGRGHLIDGIGPLLEKADEIRKREREEAAIGHVSDKNSSEGVE